MSAPTHLERVKLAQAKAFPMSLPEGVTARIATREEVNGVMKQLFNQVFPGKSDTSRFYPLPAERRDNVMSTSATHANGVHHDDILFETKDGPIGWFTGEQRDFESYYLRNAGGLPDFQGNGIATAFLSQFIDYLAACGYEAVTSQHMPTNRMMLIMMLRAGFFVQGMTLTERWGPLVDMVYQIPADRRRFYANVFGLDAHLNQATR